MINSQKKTAFWSERAECSHCWLILNFKVIDGLEKWKRKTKINSSSLTPRHRITWRQSKWQSRTDTQCSCKTFKNRSIRPLNRSSIRQSRKWPIGSWFTWETKIFDTMRISDSTWPQNYQTPGINLKWPQKFFWSTLLSSKRVLKNSWLQLSSKKCKSNSKPIRTNLSRTSQTMSKRWKKLMTKSWKFSVSQRPVSLTMKTSSPSCNNLNRHKKRSRPKFSHPSTKWRRFSLPDRTIRNLPKLPQSSSSSSTILPSLKQCISFLWIHTLGFSQKPLSSTLKSQGSMIHWTKSSMPLHRNSRLVSTGMPAEDFSKKINSCSDSWWQSSSNKWILKSTVSSSREADKLLTERTSQWTLTTGYNLKTGTLSAILKNYRISPTSSHHLSTTPNNGKNGTCQQLLRSSHCQENGTKNATVWGNWSLPRLSEGIEFFLLWLTLSLTKMEMKHLYIRQTSPLTVCIRTLTRTLRLSLFCLLVLTRIHNLKPLPEKRKSSLFQFH